MKRAEEILGKKAMEEERRWLANHELEKRRRRVAEMVKKEPDLKIQVWLRVRLGQERRVDVGRELGHREGDGVYWIMKRLEADIKRDGRLKRRLQNYEEIFKR